MAEIDVASLTELKKLYSGIGLTSNKVNCRPLRDKYEIATLDKLIDRYKGNRVGTGKDDAERFLSDVIRRSNEQMEEQVLVIENHTDKSDNLEEQPDLQMPKHQWRIHQLIAHNFKGLTEWNGKSFEIDFEGKPYFIFGHNSTGKTSILGAITWCLTECYINDRPTGKNEDIEIFAIDQKDRSIKTWPGFVTVPHTINSDEIKSCAPECFVQCELKDEEDRIFTVRRTYKAGTTEKTILLEGLNSCFSEAGITDLELDIALLLPYRVNSLGTLGHETIANNLIAVAGLEALKNIGGMADGMAKSIAALRNNCIKDADIFIKKAKDQIQAVKNEIEGTGKEIINRNIDNSLRKEPSEEEEEYQQRLCKEKDKAFEMKATEAFAVVKDGLGITDETLTPSKKEEIVKHIDNAKIAIGRSADNWEIIRSWLQVPSDVESINRALELIAIDITESLNQKYPLWKEDKDQRGKLSVQLKAAHFLKDQGVFKNCPVCDNELKEETKRRLKELSEEDANALLDLNIQLDAHIKSLYDAIPREIHQLTTGCPKSQLGQFINDNIGRHLDSFPVFKSQLNSLGKKITAMPDRELPSAENRFVSDEWDNEYSAIFEKLEKTWIEYLHKIAIAEWIHLNIASFMVDISKAIYDTEGPTGDELPSISFSLNELGKHISGYKDLERYSKTFGEAAKLFDDAINNRQKANIANLVHKTLGNIKQLKDHASNMLINITDSISTNIGEIYNILYGPYDPVKTDKLVDKCTKRGGKLDICLLLKWSDDLLADAEPISNAGKLRAILWAFSFALMEKYKPSINVVILDDSTVYFDINRSENMIEEIIKERLIEKNGFQIIATVFDEPLLHSTFARDPNGKDIGILETLPRTGTYRGCLTKPKLEPLSTAIDKFVGDNSEWKPVLEETRKYFERFMKLILRYLKEDDCSSMNFKELTEQLKHARDGHGNTTHLSSHIDVNKLVEICDDVKTRILHCTHHGGSGESKFVPDDAKAVVASYKDWKKCIARVYENIKTVLKRSESVPCFKAEEYQSTDIPQIGKYIRFKSDKETKLIGKVAAEGDVTIFADESDAIELQKLPELRCGRATTDFGSPVIWAGQTGLFSGQIPTKDGDIALVCCSGKTYLRRVFKANLANETEQGWVGQILNTNIREIPPIIARHDDKTLPLVGVLYTSEEIGTIRTSDDSEIEPIEKWSDLMKKMASGNIMLVHVTGSSAEPVVLSGQYLLVREATMDQIKDGDIYCVLLDDNRGVFKRWRSSQNQPGKILLQSINTIDPRYLIKEVVLEGAANPNGLPVVKRVLQVQGVLFEAPERLGNYVDNI